MPVSGLSVTPFQPNSGVVVLPMRRAPCSRRRAVAGASSFQGPRGSMVFEPRSVGQPRVRTMSLIDTGTPSSSPFGCPAAQRASDALASSINRSDTRLNALRRGLSAATRCSTACATSTGESVRRRKPSRSAVAVRAQRSINGVRPYFSFSFARALSRHSGQART
jgi:hypothetical protein